MSSSDTSPDGTSPGGTSPDGTSPDGTAPPPGLRLQAVEVRRFHGLDHGLEVHLCDDVNIIYGGNASGKTTLAQAIRALLWPDRVEDRFPIANATFVLDGSTWRVELQEGRCRYEQDHAPAARPSLPPTTHGPRYHLYLHDLLHEAGAAEDFARQVLQEAQGGVDVAGVAEGLGFAVPNRRTAQSTTEVERLRQKRDTTRAAQQELRRQEQTLDALRNKRLGAKAAAQRTAALAQAMEVAAARRNVEAAEATRKEFPAALEAVRGDEADTLEALQAEVEQAEVTIQTAEAEINDAEATLADSPIPDDGLPEGRLEELSTRATVLQEQERDVRRRQADREEAEQKAEAAWDRVPTGTDKEAAVDIDLPTLEAVETHVRATKRLQGQHRAVDTAKALLAGPPPDPAPETLRDGLQQLHRWLQRPNPDAVPAEAGLGRWVGVGGGLVVLGAGGTLLVVGAGTVAAIGALLVLVGAGIGAAEWWRGRAGAGREGNDRRALHKQEFGRLGLRGPDDWSRAAVEAHSDELLERLREAQVAHEARQAWMRFQADREEIDDIAEQLEQQRKRLAEQIGIAPDAGSHSLFVLLERLSRWQAAHDAVDACRAALAAAQAEAEACRTRLNAALEAYALGPVEDAGDAQRAVEALATARAEFQEAVRDRDRARNQKATAVQKRSDAQAQIQALYDRLGLDDGAAEALRARVDQHEAYQAAVETEREARAALAATRKQLRREEAHADWMETATEEALRRALDDAQREAENEDEYMQEIESIKHQIADAQEGGTLEELQARYRDRRAALAEERQDDVAAAVGRVLADFLQEETHDQGLPPVFHRAKKLFADITDHRYRLHLDTENAAFRAEDAVHETTFALDALSSGTQVQLLLAVRIAFLETQEQACRVPLVLDETLANSDEERARAIIEAVKTICAEGRQVLYLTAQADEVQKWTAGLEGAALASTVIPLDGLGAREGSVPEGDGAPVPLRNAPESLPEPGAVSHDELRAVLEVPAWSPRQPVGRMHLWYLVDAPAPLLRLLESGTRTWGPLEHRFQLNGVTATPFDDDGRRRLQALAAAVAAWKEAWHVGRGTPVGRQALEDTEAVTDTFIDGVTEIAAEQEGDAESILTIVRERNDERVQGFYSSKANDLEEYFLDHGHLVRQDTLSPEEMWQRVLADLAGPRSEGVLTVPEVEHLFSRLRLDAG